MSKLGHQIRWFIITVEHATMKQILTEFDYPERTVKRAVSELVESGELEHKRIHGTGTKRKLYTVKEEKTKQDITAGFLTEGTYKPIIAKITQRNLSERITQERRFYRKELRKWNKEGIDITYYHYHIAVMSNCLEWINRLTLAINSDMLGDSSNKTYFAQRNRLDYEEFLREICENIKAQNPKSGQRLIKEIYNEFLKLHFIEHLLPNP